MVRQQLFAAILACCLSAAFSTWEWVAILSDTHVIGPQYTELEESDALDNQSIMRTVERLKAVRDKVNAMCFNPKHAIFVGDVIHNGYFSTNLSDYYTTTNSYSIAAPIFNSFKPKVHYLWGNHDYKVSCGTPPGTGKTFSKEFSEALFKHFFNAKAYDSFDLKLAPVTYKFLQLNGMYGYTWQWDSPGCYSRYTSFGLKQLQWIKAELAKGLPTIIFVHQPLVVAVRNEFPASVFPERDLIGLLYKYKRNILHVFSGHYHRAQSWEKLYPFGHTILPSIRYDSDNHLLIELRTDKVGFKIKDMSKNTYGRCSESWQYVRPKGAFCTILGQPQGVKETGSCGNPTYSQLPGYKLPVQTNASSFADMYITNRPAGCGAPWGAAVLPTTKPDRCVPLGFNPENSCTTKFIPSIFAPCKKPGVFYGQPGGDSASAATKTCCDMINDVFRPTSGATWPSCSAQPSFWNAMKAFLYGDKTKQLMDVCIDLYGGRINYPGRCASSVPDEKQVLPPAACPATRGAVRPKPLREDGGDNPHWD